MLLGNIGVTPDLGVDKSKFDTKCSDPIHQKTFSSSKKKIEKFMKLIVKFDYSKLTIDEFSQIKPVYKSFRESVLGVKTDDERIQLLLNSINGQLETLISKINILSNKAGREHFITSNKLSELQYNEDTIKSVEDADNGLTTKLKRGVKLSSLV